MATAPSPIEKTVNEALSELEQLGEEIRLKLRLAEMDASTTWREKLEPRLFQARVHAAEAKEASKLAIHETLEAFKQFSASL